MKLSMALSALLVGTAFMFAGCGSSSTTDKAQEVIDNIEGNVTDAIEELALETVLTSQTMWREVWPHSGADDSNRSSSCYEFTASGVKMSIASEQQQDFATSTTQKEGYVLNHVELSYDINGNVLQFLYNGEVVNGERTFTKIEANMLENHAVWMDGDTIDDEGDTIWVTDANCYDNVTPDEDSRE